MIRFLQFNNGFRLKANPTHDQIAEVLKDKDSMLWVDFEATPAETDAPVLLDVFGFHPLAVDDALQELHVPKLDDWGDYLYIVLHAVAFEKQLDEDVATKELDIFIGQNYIVTHHDDKIPALDHVWESCQRDDRHWKGGADNLLYRLADDIAASYMGVVEALDDEIDLAEDKVFSDPDPHTLERIFQLKRSVLHLRRIIGPQREVMNKLARDDFQVIDARDRVYFRDVYDHFVRLYDITESIRDLVGGTLDTYLSVINNRMNDIMKTLTLITTLFMPISFVAGFFGMNFFQPVSPSLQNLDDESGFLAHHGDHGGTPVGMYFWMRSRRWM